jgi:hypothetical protein
MTPRVGIIAVLAATLALPAPGPARAAIPSGNLLGAGAGAEQGAAATDDTHVQAPPPPWAPSVGFTQVAYGAGSFPSLAVSQALGGGNAFFAGGPNVATSTADQYVNVSGAAAEIDAGGLTAYLTGQLGGFGTQRDDAKVSATFLGPDQNPLGTFAIGPVSEAERNGATTLLNRSASTAVPPGTRAIFVRITATRVDGTYDDGYADNVSLQLLAPAPPPPPSAGLGGPPAPTVGPVAPDTTITSRPPSQTPDQVVQFRFSGTVPGQINPSGGVTFGCRLDGGSFKPCTSPYTTSKLALAQHTFEVRAASAAGLVDSTPAAFGFRVTQPRAEVHSQSCALHPVGAYHDRGTRDWGPCDFRAIVCPRGALCLFDLAVDERDDSYLFNYDVHLKRYAQIAPGSSVYRDAVYCFAPPLTTPVNPKIEVRFDRRRGVYNRQHACHQEGAIGLVDTSKDVQQRFRCDGSGHAPKPGGDTTTGDGYEQDAHLECRLTVTIQRHVTELGEVLSDSPKLGPSVLVYVPQPGNVTVSGAIAKHATAAAARSAPPALARARIKARRAGAIRVPLRLNRAARLLRHRRALRLTLTTTFQPKTGAALTRTTTIRLRQRR